MANTTFRKLIVEVVDGRNLLPKDGQGTSSPYAIVDFCGQRKRTKTAVRDLNPTWNEVLDFNMAAGAMELFGDMLEVDVLHDRSYGPTRRNNCLGRIRVSSRQFVKKGEEALIYFPLEKKRFFSWTQGEIGFKIYYVDEEMPPPPPVKDEAKPPEAADAGATDAPAAPPPPSAIDSAPPDEPQTEPAPAASEPPKPCEEQSPAPPTEESASSGEPAPPPENPTPEAEKQAESEPPPPHEGTKDEEEARPPEVEPPKTETEPPVPPPPQVVASMDNKSAPLVKVAPLQPLRRPLSSGDFAADLRETVSIERTSFDLVEKMHYIFVRVVKARSLPTKGNPVVTVAVSGGHVSSKPARKSAQSGFFEWDQTFAFGRETPESASLLEVSVWDPPPAQPSDVAGDGFLGGVCFDVAEIPLRDPPDSPLAPQWYRIEGGVAFNGVLMLATWIGTQADDSFPDAWITDTAGNVHSKSKIYQSPKMWYLRVTAIEAQDVSFSSLTALKDLSVQLTVKLAFQMQKTTLSVTRNGIPSWNQDLMFVAAEPFSHEHLIFSLESQLPKGKVATLGVVRVPLTAIERRVDDRIPVSHWYSFQSPKVEDEKSSYAGRVHLRLCFDGGYHVMDEAAHVSSDFRPTARQLWKPPIGTVELGIIECKNLLPMKTIDRKGATDAYAVAKYGPKWVRTRTVSDSLDPKWNEQYTWKVYDPCTVLTVGVFDSYAAFQVEGTKQAKYPDLRMGKVRIRISTLQTGRVYRNRYPLLLLSPAGKKQMGEIELAVRFVRAANTLDVLHVYSQPLLPLMHHIKPLGMVQQEMLRNTAAKIVSDHLSRSEPALRREIVLYMLDADIQSFSMRKVRANWMRIINVVAGVIDVVRWVDDTRSWKNPTATILVHALLVLLVWFPDLIFPTLFFYVFAIGAWNYRFRSREPLPHFCPKMSMLDTVDREELDEEFDTLPSSRSPEKLLARYDKLRTLGARVQTVLGDAATQGERVQALVMWRDPRATGIFVGMCLVVAVVMYLVPSKMVAMAAGFYYMRHPMFRDREPSPAFNFFRRLPSLADRMM